MPAVITKAAFEVYRQSLASLFNLIDSARFSTLLVDESLTPFNVFAPNHVHTTVILPSAFADAQAGK